MARNASPADVALSAALAERGITASPRKIETARQAGLPIASDRVWLGRGTGSGSARPDEQVDLAADAFRLLDEVGNYVDAVLIAFVRGHPISKTHLTRAYESYVSNFLRVVARRTANKSGALDKAISLASPFSEHIRKGRATFDLRPRLRQIGIVDRDTPTHRAVFDVVVDLLQIMLGVPADSYEAHLTGATLERIVEPDPSRDESGQELPMTEAVPHLQLRKLLDLVRESGIAELEAGRDHALALRTFARSFTRIAELYAGARAAWPWMIVGNAPDITIALSAPFMVWLRNRQGTRFDTVIDYYVQLTPFFEAAAWYVNQLPTDLQVIARPGGLEQLTSDQRERLSARVEELCLIAPERMDLLQHPPQPHELVE